MKKLVMMLISCSKLAHWWAGPLFVKSWKLMKMVIFHEKVSHDAHFLLQIGSLMSRSTFCENLKVDENGDFSWKSESWCSFLAPNWLTDEQEHFLWKVESWWKWRFFMKKWVMMLISCSKLAHWWAGPLFVKSWKSLTMAIFHEKVSHDAHLFAPNWLTDEQDHFLWKVESHSKWQYFMKK